MQTPFISICIPAYSRVHFLQRLLTSVQEQTFTDFEVIVTDDSADGSVETLCRSTFQQLAIKYYKNNDALGTPENWNEGIRKATGKWIKIMHDDDWFANKNALQTFADYAAGTKSGFIFSAYNNVYENPVKKTAVYPEKFRLNLLQRQPVVLLAKNFIGPPSVTMHPNDGRHFYDNRMKWLVDIDMYVRRIPDEEIHYIPQPLINIGIGSTQVTASVKNVGTVEVPEHFLFLAKTGLQPLTQIWVYDYWWRFFRNFNICTVADIRRNGYEGPVAPVLLRMMQAQRRLPAAALRFGPFSKAMMAMHYTLYKNNIVDSI